MTAAARHALRLVEYHEIVATPPSVPRQLAFRFFALVAVIAHAQRTPRTHHSSRAVTPLDRPSQLALALDRPRVAPRSRPRSIGKGRLTKVERIEFVQLRAELARAGVYRRRPKTFGECLARPGVCGWVTCRHHRYLETDPVTGAVKLNFPGREIDEIGEPCSLKIAGEGSDDGGYQGAGHTLQKTGEYLGITLEWARQIEKEALVVLSRRVKGTKPADDEES